MRISSEQEIAQIVYSACGSPLRDKTSISEAHSNEVYSASTEDGQEVIIRIHWDSCSYFENETWALAQCRQIGLPVPELLITQNLAGDVPRSICIQKRMVGCSLQSLIDRRLITDGELHNLLLESGKLLKRLHKISTSGFGRLDGNGRGHIHSWRQAYFESISLEKAQEAAENVGLDIMYVREAAQLLSEYAHLGNSVKPCLIHGDFSPQNILIHENEISGIVDFEFCEGGDSAMELRGCVDTLPGWWDSFLDRPSLPQKWTLLGYNQEEVIDTYFEQRMRWFLLYGSLLGLSHHGINDRKNPKMMTFLKERFPKELAQVSCHFR